MSLLRNVSAVTVSRPVNGQVRPRRWWPDREPPVTTRRVHPAVLEAALALAGGDPHRLEFMPDGSVMVVNRGRG